MGHQILCERLPLF